MSGHPEGRYVLRKLFLKDGSRRMARRNHERIPAWFYDWVDGTDQIEDIVA